MQSPTKDKLINALEIPCILESPGSMANLAKAVAKKTKTKKKKQKENFWIFKKAAQTAGFTILNFQLNFRKCRSYERIS